MSTITAKQKTMIAIARRNAGLDRSTYIQRLLGIYGKDSTTKLTAAEASKEISYFQANGHLEQGHGRFIPRHGKLTQDRFIKMLWSKAGYGLHGLQDFVTIVTGKSSLSDCTKRDKSAIIDRLKGK